MLIDKEDTYSACQLAAAACISGRWTISVKPVLHLNLSAFPAILLILDDRWHTRSSSGRTVAERENGTPTARDRVRGRGAEWEHGRSLKATCDYAGRGRLGILFSGQLYQQ
jgi:hypothetical protein